MNGLWNVIIAFIVIVAIINIIVINYKEIVKHKKSKRIPLQKTSKIFKSAQWNGPLPVKEGVVKWDKTFLKELEWKLFEDVCMEYLRLKNCEAKVTSIGADGGIDMRVSDKNGNVIAVAQCKAWNKPIGVNLIRELYGVMQQNALSTVFF